MKKKRHSLRALGIAAIVGLMSTGLSANSNKSTSDFVRVENGRFVHNSEDFFFVGSNFYRLSLSDRFYGQDKRVVSAGKASYPFVDDVFSGYKQKGIKVVRIWGFSCEGAGHGANPPLLTFQGARQLPVKLNEPAFEKLDYVIDSAGRHGIKLIMPLVNFEPEYCGMGWWVKQITGSNNQHDFYTDEKVWDAYTSYVRSVLERKNQFTGKAYREDPTIMAIEVANEPHTKDYYECKVTGLSESACMQRNMKDFGAGTLVYNWLTRISAFVKEVSPNHLVSTGEEGYLASLDSLAPECRGKHRWIHNGSKGVDFIRNASIANIDFLTVHLYPDNWNIPPSDLPWFKQCVIEHRANIARLNQKPIVLEETGFNSNPDGYGQKIYKDDRAYYLSYMLQATTRAGFAGTMVWQAAPLLSDGRAAEFDDFTFPVYEPFQTARIPTPEGHAILNQVSCMTDYASQELFDSCIGICPKGTTVNENRFGIDAEGNTCYLPRPSSSSNRPYPVCGADSIISDDKWGWSSNADDCLAHPVSSSQYQELGGCSCTVN
ncbi:MAG: glycoside hydrolase 5 family protein [Oligoflexus sp.]